MLKKIIYSLCFFAVILVAFSCHNNQPKLVPADKDILLKPLDEFTTDELKKLRVRIITDYGDIIIGFYPEKAPATVKNFIKLVREGFYDNLKFHLLVPHHMIVGGDPKGDGTGGPGYFIKPEFNDLPHKRGAVGMFHPPLRVDMIGSQFYIMIADDPTKTNAYPVFGYVEKGLDVADRISELPNEGPHSKPYPWKAKVPATIKKMELLVEVKK